MDVRMISALDFSAAQALVAAIGGAAIFEDWLLAIQGFCKVKSDSLKVIELRAGKKVAVTEASACEGTLEQFHALFPLGKIFESHFSPEVSEWKGLNNPEMWAPHDAWARVYFCGPSFLIPDLRWHTSCTLKRYGTARGRFRRVHKEI
jgi:hypothetical protein